MPPTAKLPSAADSLGAVAPLATRWIERLLGAHEPPLTVPQFLALRAIAREGVSGSELARRAGVSGPAVSQLLTALAAGGLIERREHEADRRRHALTLSAGGERALSSAQGTAARATLEPPATTPRPGSRCASAAATPGRGGACRQRATATPAAPTAAA